MVWETWTTWIVHFAGTIGDYLDIYAVNLIANVSNNSQFPKVPR